MTVINTQEFKDLVFNFSKNTEWKFDGKLPVLVDFFAEWCGPCKMIAPVLEKLAKEYEGKIHIYKVDTDKEPELSAVFGISSVPSLLFIPTDGQPQMNPGALPEPQLRKAIEDVLLGAIGKV